VLGAGIPANGGEKEHVIVDESSADPPIGRAVKKRMERRHPFHSFVFHASLPSRACFAVILRLR
jgi:hypothetical protein